MALQLSGHLFACSYRSVSLHLAACRARFARCDLFVHTWTKMMPSSRHWTGKLLRRGSNTSSTKCVQQLKADLRPAAMAVDEQGSPPADGTAAPDGQPWTEGGAFHWGAGRYWGYMMTLRGMRRAGVLVR